MLFAIFSLGQGSAKATDLASINVGGASTIVERVVERFCRDKQPTKTSNLWPKPTKGVGIFDPAKNIKSKSPFVDDVYVGLGKNKWLAIYFERNRSLKDCTWRYGARYSIHSALNIMWLYGQRVFGQKISQVYFTDKSSQSPIITDVDIRGNLFSDSQWGRESSPLINESALTCDESPCLEYSDDDQKQRKARDPAGKFSFRLKSIKPEIIPPAAEYAAAFTNYPQTKRFLFWTDVILILFAFILPPPDFIGFPPLACLAEYLFCLHQLFFSLGWYYELSIPQSPFRKCRH
ncbi:MAG: hypothetical protein ACHQF3_02180 [Alphaproteobacteria bacterium]